MGRFRASRDFAYALTFAMRLAEAQGSRAIGVRHLLGGIYIAVAEKLYKYWTDPDKLDDFMIDECGVVDPRYVYWVEAAKRPGAGGGEEFAIFKNQSEDLLRVWLTAADVARPGTADPNGTPVMCPQDFLLAVAKHPELQVAQRLLASGMDLKRLEEDAGKLRRRL